jgi:hypothetical protein
MKKCDIHLPLNYSDGEPIEQEKIMGVREELVAAFGSFAVPDRRAWKYDGVKCVEIMRFEIITTDDKATKKRLKEFKERLKESLRQMDILITTYRIQAV